MGEAMRMGEQILRDASQLQQNTLSKMRSVAARMKSSPSSVGLHDVLLEWKARQSSMAKWKNYRAGTAYLDDASFSMASPLGLQPLNVQGPPDSSSFKNNKLANFGLKRPVCTAQARRNAQMLA